MELVQRLLSGDRRALARGITLVENRAEQAEELMKEIYPLTGRAHTIGITGAPGVGKSTLVAAMIRVLRREGRTVGVVAVDPTSPFSGGAILGDRVRMQSPQADRGVFVRSLATRGHLGGLSRATGDVVSLIDAFGMNVILVETVGAGQAEVDIMRYAQTTVVVLAPGLGDEIQVLKAGMMEIGDIFAVNKADRDGAGRTVLELEMMLGLAPEETGWKPPIVKTVARTGQGVEELLGHWQRHLDWLRQNDLVAKKRRARVEEEIRELLAQKLLEGLVARASRNGDLKRTVEKVVSREIDPYTAVENLVQKYVLYYQAGE